MTSVVALTRASWHDRGGQSARKVVSPSDYREARAEEVCSIEQRICSSSNGGGSSRRDESWLLLPCLYDGGGELFENFDRGSQSVNAERLRCLGGSGGGGSGFCCFW